MLPGDLACTFSRLTAIFSAFMASKVYNDSLVQESLKFDRIITTFSDWPSLMSPNVREER